MTRRIATLFAALALLFALAACGTSGGNDEADSDETPTAEETTTTADEAPAPTAEELEAILPTVDDVGADYEQDEPEDEDDSSDNDADGDGTDDDMAEACPALAELSLEGSAADNEDEVTRSFSAADDRTVEVSLDPTPKELTEETATELVDAVNECGTVDMSDDEATMTMDLAAELDDSFGDYGIRLTIGANVSMMGMELTLDFEGRYFVSEGIGAGVFVTSGIDDETLEPVPADTDLLDSLSQQLADGIASL